MFTGQQFCAPIIKLPQADGSLLVKAGRVQLAAQEVTVAQFHRQTGLSIRHILTLCEQGLILHRRLTPKPKSKIIIPLSELTRYRALDDESAAAPKMTQDDSGRVQMPAKASGATYPSARRGGHRSYKSPNPKKTTLK